MAWVKIENGVVIQKSCSEEEGFIEADDSVVCGMLYDGFSFSVPVVSQAEIINKAILKIDSDTDAIYGAVLGNRAQEYTRAEADATAYKAAGYTGTVPESVQSWATAKGWTAKQSADDILATATAWRSAQAVIRDHRLSAKEAVRAATDPAGMDLAMAAWEVFVPVIREQLGV